MEFTESRIVIEKRKESAFPALGEYFDLCLLDDRDLFRAAVGVPPVQEWTIQNVPRKLRSLNEILALSHLVNLRRILMTKPDAVKKIMKIIVDESIRFDTSWMSPKLELKDRFTSELSLLELDLFHEFSLVIATHDFILKSLEVAPEMLGRFHRAYISFQVAKRIMVERYENMLPNSNRWSPLLRKHFPELCQRGFSREEKLTMLLNASRFKLQQSLEQSVNLGVPFLQRDIMELTAHTEITMS